MTKIILRNGDVVDVTPNEAHTLIELKRAKIYDPAKVKPKKSENKQMIAGGGKTYEVK